MASFLVHPFSRGRTCFVSLLYIRTGELELPEVEVVGAAGSCICDKLLGAAIHGTHSALFRDHNEMVPDAFVHWLLDLLSLDLQEAPEICPLCGGVHPADRWGRWFQNIMGLPSRRSVFA